MALFTVDRHVLIKWHEEGEPCDIVPVQKVVEPTEATIIAGMECKALFKRKPYPATILFVGKCEIYILSSRPTIINHTRI